MDGQMRTRLQDESGFGIIELVVAVVVITVALLAIAAGFETAALSVHSASRQTVAAKLANHQIELYESLAFTSIGLDATTLTSVEASDTVYAADRTALNAARSGTDATIAGCGTASQCLPVQTVTGTDNKSYRLETFVRDVVSFGSWTERFVTVIVRNPNVSGSPEILRLTVGFDKGP
jgi:type II secretory pathway pseudopilin PulG